MRKEERQILNTALLHAFPTRADLVRMADFGLDLNLDAISGNYGMEAIIRDLIEWAGARGKESALIQAAVDANPDNAELRQVTERLQKPMQPPQHKKAPPPRNTDRPLDLLLRHLILLRRAAHGLLLTFHPNHRVWYASCDQAIQQLGRQDNQFQAVCVALDPLIWSVVEDDDTRLSFTLVLKQVHTQTMTVIAQIEDFRPYSGDHNHRAVEKQEAVYHQIRQLVQICDQALLQTRTIRTALSQANAKVATQSRVKQSVAEVETHQDELQYRVEDQPWYTSGFPETSEIGRPQIELLKDEIDVVIITANEVELKAVMRLLMAYPGKRKMLVAYIGPETYYLGKFGSYRAAVTKCRMGAIGEGSVILATEQAQRVWRPRAMIMAGVAFGKDPERQKMADVLVASQIIPYEYQRRGSTVVFRSPIPPSNATLLNRFENAPNWHFTRPDGQVAALLVGPILSGEKLVDDPVFKASLFQPFPEAIGGEMEGAGLCAASGRVGVPWILVKAICDWGDGKKHNKHQPLAAAAAVSLVHHVLSQKTVLHAIEKPIRSRDDDR